MYSDPNKGPCVAWITADTEDKKDLTVDDLKIDEAFKEWSKQNNIEYEFGRPNWSELLIRFNNIPDASKFMEYYYAP